MSVALLYPAQVSACSPLSDAGAQLVFAKRKEDVGTSFAEPVAVAPSSPQSPVQPSISQMPLVEPASQARSIPSAERMRTEQKGYNPRDVLDLVTDPLMRSILLINVAAVQAFIQSGIKPSPQHIRVAKKIASECCGVSTLMSITDLTVISQIDRDKQKTVLTAAAQHALTPHLSAIHSPTGDQESEPDPLMQAIRTRNKVWVQSLIERGIKPTHEHIRCASKIVSDLTRISSLISNPNLVAWRQKDKVRRKFNWLGGTASMTLKDF